MGEKRPSRLSEKLKPLKSQRRLYSSSPSLPQQELKEISTLSQNTKQNPFTAVQVKGSNTSRASENQIHQQSMLYLNRIAQIRMPRSNALIQNLNIVTLNSVQSRQGLMTSSTVYLSNTRKTSHLAQITTREKSSGRKTMLLYSSNKQNQGKRIVCGSFSDIHQQEHNVSQLKNNEENGEVLDDSMEVQQQVNLPCSNLSKSKERLVNTTQTMGTALKQRIIEDKTASSSNIIYQSSPNKTSMKFSQNLSQQNILFQPSQGKTVLMQKPMKLQTLTEGQGTPAKNDSQEIHIDITLDLSDKMLNAVPLLSSYINQETIPTIIDLRNNNLTNIPTSLFQIPTLRQLKLDNNKIASLPESITEPYKCRLQQFSISGNCLKSFPDWFLQHTRKTIEKLDLSNNSELQMLPDSLCHLERLKVLSINGNNIISLPRDITRLHKLEEFGLEWWQYISSDQVITAKKSEQCINSMVVTNRQTLRQIFEGLRQAISKNSQARRVLFSNFYEQYNTIYHKMEKNCGTILSQFSMICKFGHTHLLDELLLSCSEGENKLNLNKSQILLQGQTLLQVSLHTSPDEKLIQRVLKYLGNDSQYANLEVYQQRPNEELPLQRQCQLLHPLMIALKRKMISIAGSIILKMQDDLKKSNQTTISLDIKDENRNTIFHHLFALFQEESHKEQALTLCDQLMVLHSSKKEVSFQLKLNEMNKQGMTPLDLAIELRINEAVEFAIQCNQKSDTSELYFNPNFNLNQRGLSPLHRAVQSHNHYALFLLLKSQTCNLLVRDKDFKRARDFCQRLLFMQKMLRAAEVIQVTQIYNKYLQNHDRITFTFELNHAKIKLKRKPIESHQRLNTISSAVKQIKRSASELREQFGKSHAFNLFAEGDQIKPVQIERPMPIDRLFNLPYNRTVIESSTSYEIEENLYNPQCNKLNTIDEPVTSLKTQRPIAHYKGVVRHQSINLSSRHSKKISQVKPKMAQPDPHLHSIDHTSPGFMEDEDEGYGHQVFQQSSGQRQLRSRQKDGLHIKAISSFDTFVFDEADASEESPTALPSSKFQYVMTVNNSKLARRPYYKKLLQNQFEPEFCMIMEQNINQTRFSDLAKKLAIIYQIYARAQSSTDQTLLKDAQDLFTILAHELCDPHEGLILQPLMSEILYIHNRLSDKRDFKSQRQSLSHTSTVKTQEARQAMTVAQAIPSPNLRIPISHREKKQSFASNLEDAKSENQKLTINCIVGPFEALSQDGSGLLLMKSLRQSVSLKSLIGNKCQASSAFIVEQSLDSDFQIGAPKGNFFSKSKNQTVTQRNHNTSKSVKNTYSAIGQNNVNKLIEKSAIINSSDIYQQSPISPRGNSGLIIKKEYQQFHGSGKKSDTKNLNNTSDIYSPTPPSSSEYSLRSQPKRKQNLQILDSSIRTVAIHIEPTVTKKGISENGLNQFEGPHMQRQVGRTLQNRHSKIIETSGIVSPAFMEPGPKLSSIQSSSSTSLHRRYNNLAKAVVSFKTSNHFLNQQKASESRRKFENKSNIQNHSNMSQRSASSSGKAGLSKQIYKTNSHISSVPYSIKVNLAIGSSNKKDEGSYEYSNYGFTTIIQNPGS